MDVFFSYGRFHDESAQRARWVDFAGNDIPILSPEDLILHKIAFARSKDWRDIGDLLYSQRDSIDIPYIQQWLAYFFPPDETKAETDPTRVDSRVTLFNDLVAMVDRQGGHEQR